MNSGYFVKIERQDQGMAFLVTWSRGELRQHRAFGLLPRAMAFAEDFIGGPLEHNVDQWGGETWWAAK